MRPSNLFEDITEDQFKRKESEKNQYKLDLQIQIENQKRRKQEARRVKEQEDLFEEEKVKF